MGHGSPADADHRWDTRPYKGRVPSHRWSTPPSHCNEVVPLVPVVNACDIFLATTCLPDYQQNISHGLSANVPDVVPSGQAKDAGAVTEVGLLAFPLVTE
jgi:hypothetical protein